MLGALWQHPLCFHACAEVCKGEPDLFALRYNNGKVPFLVKDAWFAGAMLRPTVPRPMNPRVDPLEQHMDAPAYPLYAGEKLWTVLPAAALVQQHAATSKDFPPRPQPPGLQSPGNARRGIHAAAGQ